MERAATVKDTSVIPRGQYCYDVVTNDFLGLGKLVTKPCPYRWITGKPEHGNGYCDFLECGDGDGDGDCFILWDRRKKCGINLED